MNTAARALLVFCCLSACVRKEAPAESQIAEPQLLAVLAEPAEVAPGEQVRFRALLVDADGPRTDTDVSWSFCKTPRALRENSSVSAACASNAELPLSTRTLELDAVIPRDACARFGSETTLGQRPLDPDHTGGYYQPLRLAIDGLPAAIVRQRISCPLAAAPIEIAQRFQQRYAANRPPEIASLRFLRDGAELSFDALPAHATISLQLELAEDARESYLLYDPLHGQLGTAHEELDVRWYATEGELAHAEDAIPELSSANTLTTPEAGSALFLWLIVRDDRGGVSALERRLLVE